MIGPSSFDCRRGNFVGGDEGNGAVRKVLAYSLLLVIGLIGSQFLGNAPHLVTMCIALATMVALAFIMIHVGYEFEIDKSRLRDYGWDSVVSFTAAAFPWLFCALYFG